MATNTDVLPVKVRFGQQIRRVDIKKSLKFADLIAVLSGLFGRSFETVKYKDEDGDLVTVSSEEEFNEAVKKVVPKTGGVLKLFLHSKDEIAKKDDAVVIKGCVREAGGDIRKRNAVDHKDEEMPRKKKQDINKTEYSNSCSTASKDVHREQPSQQVVNNEPFRVYLPPAEVDADNYLPSYEVLGRQQIHSMETNSLATSSDQTKDVPMDSLSSTMKLKRSKMKKKRRRRGRRSRSHSSSSSSSSSGSSSSGCSGSSSGSSSNSSSGHSSSDSDSSDSSDGSMEERLLEQCRNEKERKKLIMKLKKRQRKRHELKRVARQLTHYVAPEVCDEVANCMHYYKKQLKQSMARNIAGTIETTITNAFKQFMNEKTLPGMTSGEDSEAQIKKPARELYYHADITCDGCDQTILGPRYKCGNCADYDLCEECEAIEGIHDETHVFLKIHVPALNAGRKKGSGRMRPLLKENIYENNDKKVEESLEKASTPEQQEFNIAMETQPALNLQSAEKPALKEDEIVAFKILPARSVSSDSVPAKDEEVCAALEGLKIAQSSHKMSTDNVENQKDVNKVKDAESDCHVKAQAEGVVKERNVIDDDDDDDVVVVRPDHTPRVRTLDLVDNDSASVSSNGSEDFVVVPIPKYFDLNSPLDEDTIREHWNHCKGAHAGDCCPAGKILKEQRKEKQTTNIPVDLVESSLPKSRQQPDIAQIQNMIDANMEKIAPKANIIEEQPAVTLGAMPPLIPITNQPTSAATKPKDVRMQQPEAPVMFGRGSTPMKFSAGATQEPSQLTIRNLEAISKMGVVSQPDVAPIDRIAGNAMIDDSLVKDSATARNPPMLQDSTDGSAGAQFNQPADKFLQQHREHLEQGDPSLRAAQTWEPEPSLTEAGAQFTQAVAGVITGIVDATSNVVAAVGESVSNAVSTGNDLPTVRYKQEQVKIMTPEEDQAVRIQGPQMPKTPAPARSAQDMLQDMGFFDEMKNRRLLEKHQGDVNKCVNELLGDNNWHSNRH